VNPAGLTRAEEEKERAPGPPAADRPIAPGGTLACQVVVPPGDACGVAAEVRIVWPRDPDAARTPACLACAARMRAVARTFGADVRVESLSTHTIGAR